MPRDEAEAYLYVASRRVEDAEGTLEHNAVSTTVEMIDRAIAALQRARAELAKVE